VECHSLKDVDVRLACVVDGFNLYNSLTDAIADGRSQPKVKWLNIRKMCERHISKFGAEAVNFERISYCTSLVGAANSTEQMRQKVFNRACMNESIDVILGNFKTKTVSCRLCHRTYTIPVEKETDINIALQIIKAGIDGFDGCMLVSGDSDLAAAARFSRNNFPAMKLVTLLPFKRHTSGLHHPDFGAVNLWPELDYNDHVLPFTISHPAKDIKIPKYWETGIK